MSHDIEDIVAVFDGRVELVNDVKDSGMALIQELSKRFTLLLKDERFVEAVSGHMPADNISQQRVSLVLEAMGKIAKL